MATLGAFAGLLLLWCSGAALLATALAAAKRSLSGMLLLAYGLPLGWVALVLWMRLLSLAGVSFGLLSVGLPLLFVCALGRVWASPRLRALTPACEVAARWRDLPAWARVVWWSLLALLAARGLVLLMEVLWRPTFGWDAWTHWATKARVWHELGKIVPFGTAADVLAGTAAYTDANPHYPAALPLLQVWMALSAGGWDDTLVNLPWLALALALGLGMYAQLRAAGGGPLFAMGVCYLLLALPFVNVHVALPGYADLPLAVFVGLATMAFWRWTVDRDPVQLALTLALAAAGPVLKTPGWIWLGLLLPASIPVLFARRGWTVLLALAAGAAVLLLVLAHYHPRVLGYELHAGFHPVWRPLLDTLLHLGNWHLLWYLTPALVLLGWRDLASPRLAGLSAFLAGGMAFLFVVFFFSNAALWVTDLSTVNRALLHLVPTVVFYDALLVLGWRQRAVNPASATSTSEAPPAPAHDRSQ